MKTKILALAVLTLFAVGVAVAAAVNTGPATIKIDTNKSGKAVPAFPHQKHQGLPALKDKCTECHHTLKAGETPKACGTCHTKVSEADPATKAPGFKDAFHKKCQGCHKEVKDKPDLNKCKTCHGA